MVVDIDIIIEYILFLSQANKMIRVRGLVSSLKSNLLTTRNAFPHKMQESWDSEFKEQNPKLNYLQKLLQSNSIRPYFIDKDIQQLQKQDLYFYMQNKQLFHTLIKNPNANTILKFHLALELNTLKNQEVQKHLLHSFNTSLHSLKNTDIIFCLEIISGFRNVSDNLNYYQLEKIFIAEEDPQLFIKFVYILSEFQFQLEIITPELIQERISTLQNLQIQIILHAKKASKFYEVQLTPFNQTRLRSSFMQKRRDFKQNEAECIVELLQYYPQSANLLNTECLSPQSYVSYLQFFIPQEQGSQNQLIPKAIQHPIPRNIVSNAHIPELYNIIKHRVTLQLQTPDSLVSNMKDFYTKDLNCITTIIRYLEKQEKMTPQIQSIFQKSLMNKIIKNGEKSFEEFKIVDVFKIIGYLSVNELGTINFWKKSLKFVTNTIENSQNYRNLSSDQQKKFVVYLFQIFKNKPFPRELQDQIINLTLLSLTINRWSLRQILPLTISLKVNKIADNELWFGIQQRINQINTRHMQSNEDRKTLRKIVFNFNMIGKGSYQFWSQINKNLNKKQKTQILSSFKIPSTMAHTYLKV